MMEVKMQVTMQVTINASGCYISFTSTTPLPAHRSCCDIVTAAVQCHGVLVMGRVVTVAPFVLCRQPRAVDC